MRNKKQQNDTCTKDINIFFPLYINGFRNKESVMDMYYKRIYIYIYIHTVGVIIVYIDNFTRDNGLKL
jgi:hypothetical protein